MNPKSDQHDREHMDSVFLHAPGVLPAAEIPGVEAQIALCAECRQQIETLRLTVNSFVSWPTDLLRPSMALWGQLANRIAKETGEPPLAALPEARTKPEWEEPAPGISCQLLATDAEKERVTMLVRLAAGAEYPPHRHAGVEELYLLDGVLMINDQTLYPGDYSRREVDTVDHRVWTNTGCTCVLITSTGDIVL